MTGGLKDRQNALRRRVAFKKEKDRRAKVITECIKQGKCTRTKAVKMMRAARLIIPGDTRMGRLIRYYKSVLKDLRG